jgi:WD40 repeat protein
MSTVVSSDGNTLAVSIGDTVQLWDLASGELRHTVTGDSGLMTSATFSPDGRTLAVASAEGTARLWDTATGVLVHTLIGHAGAVNSVGFSPDGRTVATAGADGTVRLWDASTGQIRHTLNANTDAVYVQDLCAQVGRAMTPAEWATYLPETPYERVC